MNERKINLDPRTILYVVALLSTSAFFMNKPLTAHLICAFASIFLIGIKEYKGCFCYVLTYCIIAFLMSRVEKLNSTMLALIIISISYFAQKFIVLMMMGTFLVKTTSIPYVLSAMQTMKFPDMILIPFTVSLRFFPTIKEDHRYLEESLKLRKVSVSPLQLILHPIKTLEYLIVPILLRSVRTADELSASALLRGIERSNKKTMLYPLRFNSFDFIVIAITTIITGILFWLQLK